MGPELPETSLGQMSAEPPRFTSSGAHAGGLGLPDWATVPGGPHVTRLCPPS